MKTTPPRPNTPALLLLAIALAACATSPPTQAGPATTAASATHPPSPTTNTHATIAAATQSAETTAAIATQIAFHDIVTQDAIETTTGNESRTDRATNVAIETETKAESRIVRATQDAEATRIANATAAAGATATTEAITFLTEFAAEVPLQVAYVKDGDIWLWRAETGTTTQLVDLQPDHTIRTFWLSPDGAVLIFPQRIKEDGFTPSLWAINTDGTNERMLISADELNNKIYSDEEIPVDSGFYQFRWIPGTHTLLYNTVKSSYGPVLSYDLHTINVDTGYQTTLFPPGEGGVFSYSPDGRQIALVTPTSISLVNADGSNYRRDLLTFDLILTYSEYKYHPSPRWLPDSSGLLVAVPPADPEETIPGPTTIWHIPANGGSPEQITTVDTLPFFWSARVSIFPELNAITYPTGDYRNWELNLLNLDDGSSSVIQSPIEHFLGWSPDLNRYLFTTPGSDRPQVGQLDGSHAPLTDLAEIVYISWVDDEWLLFFAKHARKNTWELYLSNLNGQRILIDVIEADRYDLDYDFSK